MLECDYLVVGTGASGMAFADAIVSESTDRSVIMIDKLPEPGGHWNHAYEFVRLHQPACYYGVASEKLEREGETALYQYKDLSNREEILAYYRFVMDKMLKTGRVKHFGECTYQHPSKDETGISETDGSSVHSFVDKEGLSQQVKVNRRVVDAKYSNIQVPSTNPPRYNVEPGVECIPINGIYGIGEDENKRKKKFVIVGSGKTGIDAALYLLDNGIDPANITWIMPRDAWLIDRNFVEPRTLLLRLSSYFGTGSDTLKENLLEQERGGMLMRLDTNIWPEKYSCATVETFELEKLRSIRNIIRKGRVSSITNFHLIMVGNEKIPYERGSIVVDCSSNGLTPRPAVPIFQPGKIVLQPVRMCMICISAAMAGYVECHEGFSDDEERNRVMVPVPHPESNRDAVRSELLEFHNTFMGFGDDPRTKNWHESCRLNIEAHSSPLTTMKLFAGKLYSALGILEKCLSGKKKQHKEAFGGQEFEFQVFCPKKLEKNRRIILAMTVLFYGFVSGAFIALFYGLQFSIGILHQL